MIRLVILDPGLATEGGHHMALLETVSMFSAESKFDAIDVFCNASLEVGPLKLHPKGQVNITPFFNEEFYAFYNGRPSIAEAQGYISRLAGEYEKAFRLCIHADREPQCDQHDGRIVFLYPAMYWEHLQALSFVLERLHSDFDGHLVEHRVCLMFNPGRDYAGNLINLREWLSYRLACKALGCHSSVAMYASDFELSNHFGELLDISSPLPIHPQYLVGRQADFLGGSEGEAQSSSLRRIGLYFGDAKAEKGFLQLPEILTEILPSLSREDEVIIHFTAQGNCQRIGSVIDELSALACHDHRIKVFSGFLPLPEILSLLRSLTALVFGYDSTNYRNKSSGFLWVAALAGCRLVFLSNTWLSREAKRLGLPFNVCDLRSLITTLSRKQGDVQEKEIEHGYCESIFRSFDDWLITPAVEERRT